MTTHLLLLLLATCHYTHGVPITLPVPSSDSITTATEDLNNTVATTRRCHGENCEVKTQNADFTTAETLAVETRANDVTVDATKTTVEEEEPTRGMISHFDSKTPKGDDAITTVAMDKSDDVTSQVPAYMTSHTNFDKHNSHLTKATESTAPETFDDVTTVDSAYETPRDQTPTPSWSKPDVLSRMRINKEKYNDLKIQDSDSSEIEDRIKAIVGEVEIDVYQPVERNYEPIAAYHLYKKQGISQRQRTEQRNNMDNEIPKTKQVSPSKAEQKKALMEDLQKYMEAFRAGRTNLASDSE